MELVKFVLHGESPMSHSRYINEKRLSEKETAQDFEARTWKGRLHVNENGEVIIPPMMVKNALAECAKFLGIQIPGKGKSNYTKHFEAGLLASTPIRLGIKAEDVKGEWLFLNADGRRGGNKRVEKCYPRIEAGWEGEGEMYILDALITHAVFEHHLKSAGQFIGLGRFRPRMGGFYGRFSVKSVKYAKVE